MTLTRHIATNTLAAAVTVTTLAMLGGIVPVVGAAARPASATAGWNINAMAFATAQTGWVAATTAHGTVDGVLQTRDGGRGWTLVASWTTHRLPPWTPTGMQAPPPIAAMAFSNARDGLAITYGGAGAGQLYVDVIRTVDGGRHWRLAARNLHLENGPISLVMTGPETGWMANGSFAGPYTRVFRTGNGGAQWTQTRVPYPGAGLNPEGTSLHVSGPTDGTLLTAVPGLSGKSPAVFDQITTDGGKAWTTRRLPSMGLPGDITGAAYWSPAVQWVAAAGANGPSRLYSYRPAAHRWQTLPLSLPSGSRPVLDLLSASTAYVSGNGDALYKTVDGGQHWTRLRVSSTVPGALQG